MKKLFKFTLCSLMGLSLVACGSGDTEARDTLIVGTPEISGDFMEGFGNSSYDLYVKNLLTGYETYNFDQKEEDFLLDETAMAGVETLTNEDGSKTYTFTVNEDLTWSDGETIDANDYAFSMLWQAGKAWVTAGAASEEGDGLIGYDAYHEGTANAFAAVQLIDDYNFSLTIDAAELPYFYEMNYVSVKPLPQHIFSPESKVLSTPEGAYIDAADLAGDMAVVADGEGAFRFAPTVSCGPYEFVSFKNQIVTLEINEEYAGDPDGDLPTIPTVIVKYIDQSTDVDQLIAGDVDIINGVVEGDKIEKAKKEIEAGNLAESNYARSGYGYVAMANEHGATAIKEVRHAIAYILDNDEIINSVLGGYGTSVAADYGVSQWMYQENADAIEELNYYSYSIANANASLDKTDYLYEADGVTLWDAEKATADNEYYRYNSAKEVLEIKHFGTDDNTVTDTVENQFNANSGLVGIDFSITRGDFDALLSAYYYRYDDAVEDRYHTFNLAVGFTPVYDPYYSYHSDYFGTWQNSTQTSDPTLDALIMDLRSTSSTDRDAYAAKWLTFQQAWNDYLPMIPIYSNSYFDFYNSSLEGVDTSPLFDWSKMICKIKWAE